ncbi:MAG: hypothetical protein AB8D78_11980 [Akkermansiaceae bacterium]
MIIVSTAEGASVVYHFVPISAFNKAISSTEGLIGIDSETNAEGGTVASELEEWLVSGEDEQANLSATTEPLPEDFTSIKTVRISCGFTISEISPIRGKTAPLLGKESLGITTITSLSSYFPLEGAFELARKQFGKRRMKDFEKQAIEGILRLDG